MIRAVMTKDNGNKALILGVDDENVRRLTSGDPIMVNGEAMGLSFDVVILHGATTSDILAWLRKAGFNLPEDPRPGEVYEHTGAGYVVSKKSPT